MYDRLRRAVKKNKKLADLYRKIIKADIVERKFIELEEKLIYNYINKLEKRVEELEKQLNIPVKSRKIEFSHANEPSLESPISQLVTASQLKSDLYAYWVDKLNLPNYPHRKTWEFVYICQVLQMNGLVSEGGSGIGFGVGKDPIVSFLAGNNVNVLATDLDLSAAKSAGWVDSNQHSTNVAELNSRGIATDAEMNRNVKFRHVDMNNIPEDLGVYDFAWSACAFEHLGSIEKGLEFVKNSLKYVRPGGVCVHTTEFNLSSNEETIDNQGTVLFRKKDIERLAQELINEGHSIQLNFDAGGQALDQYYDIPPYSDYTHLKLLIDNYISTSIGLTVIKKS